MAETKEGNRERRAAARAARREREQAEAARARRRTRLFQLGGALALAVAVIVVIVLATGGGDDGPTRRAGEAVAGQNDTAQLLSGIPQRGAVLGDPRAPVTLIEFADLQCPWCKQAAEIAMPSIINEYVRDGHVKLVFRDVAFLGADSVRGAQMAAAAARQDKLWDYVHLFYVNQGTENSGYVTDDFLREIGGGIAGLDVERAMAERGSGDIDRAIAEARTEWQSYGLDSTPAFAAGRSGGTLEAVEVGSDVLAALRERLDALLADAGTPAR